ncbi:DEAD/DEAH box helicase [Flavobacterium agricola]|uniref:DEAD/DEAH box helicase n=1 Tax=Flavobacterium agricola TaxID=2870839 RepID=A0ABY6M0U1_9FLAO|nr:DEAD/DEAH box helicase [Flavobacterium agricola]UYW02141.1 DEAD/DEAH box helicase [Flavobacterium agricola]
MKFIDLKLSNNVLEAINEAGYQEATPIQEQVIPEIILGNDIVGCAQTGTGKTAAFTIPIVNNLHRIVGSGKKVKYIRTVILAPTRELAQQLGENFDLFTTYTSIKSLVIYGGVNQVPQVNKLKEGVDVLIATPGRFLDLYKQGFINLNHMHHLVIDEADLMLDMGFINDVKKIIKLSPENRQTLLFSATMPMEVRALADEFLTRPKYVSVDPISSASANVSHQAYLVEKEDKRNLLKHLIETKELKNVLVFVRTKHGADATKDSLVKQGIKADSIHGDKSQAARNEVLEAFKNKEIDVLLATDVAARGIDIDDLPLVINFDLPNIAETFVHRIGRTGRAGASGLAISFCSKDEKTYLTTIERHLREKIKVVKDNPFPWRDESTSTGKKDFRKKFNPNPGNKPGGSGSNSRKSENSKKNKKRWY